jgi:hypothetical protein
MLLGEVNLAPPDARAFFGNEDGDELPILCTTSIRKPWTPRSSQKRRAPCIASATAGSSQFEVRLLEQELVRPALPRALVESPRRVSPCREKLDVQSLADAPLRPGSRQTYHDRRGSSRLEREAWNHGCGPAGSGVR